MLIYMGGESFQTLFFFYQWCLIYNAGFYVIKICLKLNRNKVTRYFLIYPFFFFSFDKQDSKRFKIQKTYSKKQEILNIKITI